MLKRELLWAVNQSGIVYVSNSWRTHTTTFKSKHLHSISSTPPLKSWLGKLCSMHLGCWVIIVSHSRDIEKLATRSLWEFSMRCSTLRPPRTPAATRARTWRTVRHRAPSSCSGWADQAIFSIATWSSPGKWSTELAVETNEATETLKATAGGAGGRVHFITVVHYSRSLPYIYNLRFSTLTFRSKFLLNKVNFINDWSEFNS